MAIVGGVEGGGTKFVCAIGSTGDRNLLDRRVIATSEKPSDTIDEIIAYFKDHSNDLSAIGIATFGPVVLDITSPKYGWIASTPKPGWSNLDMLGPIQRAFPGLPIGFDTDVNGAALGEQRWGTARGRASFVYVNVGTGVGCSGVIEGRPIHGLLHPEMGHMRIPHDRRRDPFSGACPFHGDCWEGLASGRAIERRWGRRGELLPDGHEAWPLEARYLGLGIANLIFVLSPHCVILGGEVTSRPVLLAMVQSETRRCISGYPRVEALSEESISDYLRRSSLGGDSGILGALELARKALGLP